MRQRYMVQRRADLQQVIVFVVVAAATAVGLVVVVVVVAIRVHIKFLPCFEAKPLCEQPCCQLPNGLVTHWAPHKCIGVASAYYQCLLFRDQPTTISLSTFKGF